ncbi:MAG TPA: alpha/beta fold hydrolase [Thermoanaerobaculia bacterium]|mgnify:CR=1 FL=1|nr:alpha/beta fold hydrolase [Thermoanaerobaculia bacterium]
MAQPREARNENSTTVRSLGALRASFSALGYVAPDLAAAAAERLFFTPFGPRRSRGEALLSTAEPLRLSLAGRPLAAWRWGQGPAVLLQHGWAGQGAQLTAFVEPLLEQGLSVATFDAPGHGRSGRGLSSLVQFAQALEKVAQAVGPVHGVVAHSLGAAGVAFALRHGLPARRIVFLAPAADPPAWIHAQAPELGISPTVLGRLRRRSERRLGVSWDEVKVPEMAATFRTPLLIFHDSGDRQVPFSEGTAIAASWPEARLVATEGLGHNRLLRDPEVVAEAVEFLASDLEPCPACARPISTGTLCERCRFDRELFDPNLRRKTAGPGRAPRPA